MRRTIVMVLVLGGVSGCAGHTLPATEVKQTSAVLHAEAACKGKPPCAYYFRWGVAGQGYTKRGKLHKGIGNTGGLRQVKGRIGHLSPSTTYAYQLCGKGDEVPKYVCVGPDGKATSAGVLRTDGTRVGVVDHVYYTKDVGTLFSTPAWTGLHRTKARIAVPWDIGLRGPDDPKRAAFQGWLDAVQRSGAEPYVTFVITREFDKPWVLHHDGDNKHRAGSGRCFKRKGSPGRDCYAPNLAAYSAAVGEFMRLWPQIRVIGAWNEPNYAGLDKPKPKAKDLQYHTLNGRTRMDRAHCNRHSTVRNCGPLLAATYWGIVHKAFVDRGAECTAPQPPLEPCIDVAGEFTGNDPLARSSRSFGFFGAYQHYLPRVPGGGHPFVWAIHPYVDGPSGAAGATRIAREVLTGGGKDTRFLAARSGFLRSDEPGFANRVTHLWISATGANFDKYGDAGQRNRLAQFFSALTQLNLEHPGRIPRVYVYNLQNKHAGAGNDHGLVSPADATQQRAAWRLVRDANP